MTPTADPRRALNLALGFAVGVGVLAVAGAACWAFMPPRLPDVPPLAIAKSAEAPGAPHPIDATMWGLALWRPLTDAPGAPAVVTPMKLFSILDQAGERIAALDPDDGSGLIYARAGERVRGATVTAIEPTAVVLAVDGKSQRLELPR